LINGSEDCSSVSKVGRSVLEQLSETAVGITEGADEEDILDGEAKTRETGDDMAIDDATKEDDTLGRGDMTQDAALEETVTLGEEIKNETVVDDVIEEDETVVDDATLDEDEKATRAAATSVSLR
jgi:hypothetical protein